MNACHHYSADANFLKTFSITNRLLSSTPTSQSSFAPNYPRSTLGLSSNGNINAILRAIERSTTISSEAAP